jgi:hypothetical protein
MKDLRHVWGEWVQDRAAREAGAFCCRHSQPTCTSSNGELPAPVVTTWPPAPLPDRMSGNEFRTAHVWEIWKLR